jgi:hypothetical protein
MRTHHLLAALALTLVAAAPLSTAHADFGHIGLVGGATSLDESGSTEWRPQLRAEAGIRIWGPFELGGYAQLTTLGFPAEMPSFGGGAFVQLRPDVSFFGFVPHAEVSGSRVTLPSANGRIDAWGLSVGGGFGYELGAGVVIEGRLHHNWYFDIPQESGAASEGWTITGGITYRIPS